MDESPLIVNVLSLGTSFALVVLLGPPESGLPSMEPPPQPAAAWAAAYALGVQHFCHYDDLDDFAMARSGGLPFEQLDDSWDRGGAMHNAFHDGGATAERAFSQDPAFCSDPISHSGSHAALVARFLKIQKLQ